MIPGGEERIVINPIISGRVEFGMFPNILVRIDFRRESLLSILALASFL